MPMGRQVSLAGMLLVAAAQSLIIVSVLQLAPLASSAGFRLPKIGSYQSTSPARTQPLKDFLRKHGPDVADIAQNLIPPPAPPAAGGSGGQMDNAPATTMGLYFADLIVGTTPAQKVSGILDICTQFVWMQCACRGTAVCPRVAFVPPDVDYSSRTPRTFELLPCNGDTCQGSLRQTCARYDSPCGYVARYGGDATVSMIGYLASDTFTFDTTAVKGMIFGCSTWSDGKYYDGASGVIGLGRGPLSLVTQLALSNFSYFLAPVPQAGSSNGENKIQLGGVTVPQTGRSRSRSTPLLPSLYLYYVRLTGIKVDGEELVGIPAGTFDLGSDGSGGVFLSITTPVTYLLEDAYRVVRQAFVNKIPSQPLQADSLDSLCYTARSMQGVNVPRLTLVFDGWDAEMELRTSNYFYEFNDGERDLECLAVLPSRGASLLGSLLQTGTTMVYDLVGEKLTFVTEDDSQSSQAPPTPMGSKAQAPASLAMLTAAAVWVLACFMLL